MNDPVTGYAAACAMRAFERLAELQQKMNSIRARIGGADTVGLEWEVWRARTVANRISRDLSAMFYEIDEMRKKKTPDIKAVS